ncbi:MAG: dockerin type I repeat-containing protein [Clostridia bacterium]|nr:dockerin type I repeat-containing protein [Clostridia bacterium]
MKKKLLSILLCITFVLPFAVSGVSACDDAEGVVIVYTIADLGIESDEPCEFFGFEVLGVEKIKAFPENDWYKYRVKIASGTEQEAITELEKHEDIFKATVEEVRCADPESHMSFLMPQRLIIETFVEPDVKRGDENCKLFGVEIERVDIVRPPLFEGGLYSTTVYVTEGKEWEILDQLMLHPQVVAVSRDYYAYPDEFILLGDVDFDDDVDATDYALAKRHCLKTFELSEEATESGDVNQDGVFDAKDYALIKRTALGTLDYRYVS